MIRVRFLSQLTAASAALASLPMLAGCTASTEDHDKAQTGDLAETGIEAGTGTLSLYDYALHYKSTSGGDEFVRVGERLTASVRFEDVASLLYLDPSDGDLVRAIRQDPSKVKVSLKVTYTKFDDAKSEVTLPITFAPGPGGVSTGTSPEFLVPPKVKALTAEYVASFEKAGAPSSRDLLGSHGVRNGVVVFGGFVPDKLALFDTSGADRRTRIVEGGHIVAGANVVIAMTDWRLDTIADKATLDLRYGRKQSYSRFGPTIIDAVGSLEYVVSAAISVDDGKTFLPLDLDRVADADVFGRDQYGRFTFQKLLAIPENAGPNVKIAFHVQAYLNVPSYGSDVVDAHYGPGQRILLRDVWDNAGGANYSLPVSHVQE